MRALVALCLLLSVAGLVLGTPNEAYAIDSVWRSSAQSEIQIGDVIEYQVEVVVDPIENLLGSRLVDSFDFGGFEYVDGSAWLEFNSIAWFVDPAFAVTSEPERDSTTPGSPTLTWYFGDMYNTPGVETFRLHYQIRYTGERPDGTREFFVPTETDVLTSSSTYYWTPAPGEPEQPEASGPDGIALDQPLLTLDKDVAPGTDVLPGEHVDFGILVVNDGWAPAYEVIVTDTLPSGFAWLGSYGTWDASTYDDFAPDVNWDGTSVTFDFGTMPLEPGQGIEIWFCSEVPESAEPGMGYTNTADVDWSSLEGDVTGERVYDDKAWESDWTDDTDSVEMLIADAPFVKVTKTIYDPVADAYPVGAEVTFEIIYENIGSQTAEELQLWDHYENLRFLTSTAGDPYPQFVDTGSDCYGAIEWEDPTGGNGLAPGASLSILATFEVAYPERADNCAHAEWTGETLPPEENSTSVQTALAMLHDDESVPTPQVSTESYDWIMFPVYDPADMVFWKDADPAPGTVVLPGDVITYTIGGSNDTGLDFGVTRVIDALPTSVEFMPGTLEATVNSVDFYFTDDDDGDGGTYDEASHTIVLERPFLLGGDFGEIRFQVRVRDLDYSYYGVLNSADLYLEDVYATSTNDVYHPVDPIDIYKTATDVNGGRLVPGDEILWEITVENVGLSPTTNVVITDSAPTFTTYVPGSITGIGADDSAAPDFTWNIGVLPLGGSATVSFRTTVDAGVPSGTIISNQAMVESDNSLPKLSDEPATPEVGDPTLLTTGGDESALLVLGALVLAAGLVLALKSRKLLGDSEASV